MKKYIPWVLVLLAGSVFWYLINSAPWLPGETAPQVADMPKQTITPPKVRVLPPAAKKKLNLSKEIQADKNLWALGAVRIPKSDHPVTVTPLFNEAAGETEILVREEPLPWLAREQSGAVRIDYLLNRRATVLSGRLDLLQIKKLHAGFSGSVSDAREWNAGVGVEIRF